MAAPGLVEQRSRFISPPSTPAGRWSAWLLVASLILILLNSAVIMPSTESTGRLDMAQQAINLAVFLTVVATGLTGLYAVAFKRERSVVVFLSILLLAFAVAMNVAELFS